VGRKAREDPLRMFDNLTNHGMLDLMEKHFDKHIKKNFRSKINETIPTY
jgi:hypothetical protein